jgi:chromate transporter
MAHVAMMEDELVTRRKWCDRQYFLDMLAAVNFIPGPNSTELAIHMGYVRAGVPGLVVAGVCFITPAVLIILPLAYLYVRYQTLPAVLPVLHTIGAAIIAIIAVAAVRLAVSVLRTKLAIVVALLTLIILSAAALEIRPIAQAMRLVQPEIVLLAIAAVVGILWSFKPSRIAASLAVAPLPLSQSLPAPVMSLVESPWVQMIWFFFKVGATLFGSGYVLPSFLQSGLVDRGNWLTQTELTDAIAVGQFTPGPLLTTATFIGYLLGYKKFEGGDSGGVLGAILATGAIFLPAFLLIAILAPFMQRLHRSRIVRGALDGMNAAVVVLIGYAVARMSPATFTTSARSVDLLNVAIAIIAAVLMLRLKLNATWLVLGAAALGVGRVIIGR